MRKKIKDMIMDAIYRIKGIWVDKHPRNVHGGGLTQIVTPEEYKNDPLIRDFYGKNKMPCCGSISYYEGPTGGASMNITCTECKKRFNICQPIGLIEEI